MKTLIPAKAKVISRDDKFIWPYNLLEIDFRIDEIQTDCTLQLAKENIEDAMDIFNSELVELCEQMTESSKFSITRDNKVTELTPRKLAYIVSDLAFRAFAKWSEWKKNPFKVEVKWPNTIIREFKKANKAELIELEKLQKQLWKKEPTNSEILQAIKNLQLQPIVQTNTQSINWFDNVQQVTATKQTVQYAYQWDEVSKFTKAASLDFMSI